MAGHIIGAASIYIQGKEGTLFYSGDFSSTPQQTVGRISIPKLRPDAMVIESTYGDKLHSNRQSEEERLVKIVKEVIERGGKILIPAFAVGRAKGDILGIIQKLAPRHLFLVHGNPDIIQTLSKEVQPLIRGKVYIPINGEDYSIRYENPRKQLSISTTPPMNKGYWPEENDLEELWKVLSASERIVGYTLEELIYIWSGRKDFGEVEISNFQKLLDSSIYFEPEERKLFLYHPVLKESLPSPKEEKVMELNEMLSLVDELFPPETGLYKKGARFEEKIALLYFNFPGNIPEKYSDTIKEFEQRTGWTVNINTQCNLSAIEPLIRKLLGEEQNLLLKTSYYGLKNEVKVFFQRSLKMKNFY